MKKFSKNIRATLAMASLTLASAVASAAPVTPTFDFFGALPGATFGGTGIPNDAVAVTRVETANSILTLGLTATQRYFNPALTNDGAGTFTATPGTNNGTPGQPGDRATWNLGFYFDTSAQDFDGLILRLYYDNDPNVATDEADLGFVELGSPKVSSLQDSWNATFAFLQTSGPGVSAPSYGAFNANVAGEYFYALEVRNQAGARVAYDAIKVLVQDPNGVPEPTSLALALAGFAGVGASRYRIKK